MKNTDSSTNYVGHLILCQHVAEGKERKTLKEFIQFLTMARGSVEEIKYLLLLSKDLGFNDKRSNSLIKNTQT